MRQLFLDTETTGLELINGNRLVEIGAVEVIDGVKTGHNFHVYLNPERVVEEGALKVHGLTTERLSKEKKFKEVSNDFIQYLGNADEVLIHNADFDVGFVNMELLKAGQKPIWEHCKKVSCTLKIAKSLHPKKRNNLDVLCERYGIDNTHRELHGALLDAELLAEMYMKMTDGVELAVDDEVIATKDRKEVIYLSISEKPKLKTVTLSPLLLDIESKFLAEMKAETGVDPVGLKLSASKKMTV